MVIKSTIFSSNKCLGQKGRHCRKRYYRSVFGEHSLDNLAIIIVNNGRLRRSIPGNRANIGQLQANQEKKQTSHKNRLEQTDDDQEYRNVLFRINIPSRSCL